MIFFATPCTCIYIYDCSERLVSKIRAGVYSIFNGWEACGSRIFLSLSLFSLKFNQIKTKPNKNVEITVDKKNIKNRIKCFVPVPESK